MVQKLYSVFFLTLKKLAENQELTFLEEEESPMSTSFGRKAIFHFFAFVAALTFAALRSNRRLSPMLELERA